MRSGCLGRQSLGSPKRPVARWSGVNPGEGADGIRQQDHGGTVVRVGLASGRPKPNEKIIGGLDNRRSAEVQGLRRDPETAKSRLVPIRHQCSLTQRTGLHGELGDAFQRGG